MVRKPPPGELDPCCCWLIATPAGQPIGIDMPHETGMTAQEAEDRALNCLGLRGDEFYRSLLPPSVKPVSLYHSDAIRRIPGPDAPELHSEHYRKGRKRLECTNLPRDDELESPIRQQRRATNIQAVAPPEAS